MTHRMSTHEMLELASLDALGLLSEEERESFDLAFRAAAPALQAQIRAEQARVAGDDALLPRVEPPLGLRARVLAAVREAMQSVGGRRHVAGRIAPDILPGRGVSPIWRAAAIGCLAASIVFAFTTLQMKREYETITTRMVSDAWAEQVLADYGGRFDRAFFATITTKVSFEVVSDSLSQSAGATLLINGETGVAEFWCKNLPLNEEYQLVTVDSEDNIVGKPLLTFQPTASRFQRSVEQARPDAGLRLAIVSVERGGGEPQLLMRAQLT